MTCSVLPLVAFCSEDAASRMSFYLSFAFSPACHRRLQRVIDGGMGLFARQVPLAYWKKALLGCTLRSRSFTSTPCERDFCAKPKGLNESQASVNSEQRRIRINV